MSPPEGGEEATPSPGSAEPAGEPPAAGRAVRRERRARPAAPSGVEQAGAPGGKRPSGPFAALDDPEADAKLRQTPAPLELLPPPRVDEGRLERGGWRAQAATERVARWDAARVDAMLFGHAPIPDLDAKPEPVMRHSGVSFGFPEGWSDQSVIILRESAPREFRRNAVVLRTCLGPDRSLEWFAGAQLHELVMKFRLAAMPQVTPVTYCWGKFVLATYRIGSPTGGPGLRQTVAFHLVADAGYVITFSAREDDYDAAWAEAFEPILASFAFLRGLDGSSLP